MPRPAHNTFDLSHSRKFSMSIGKITPISVMECVPGDSFNIKTTQLVRFAPLIAPIMHEASVYCHFFFVPNRLVWDQWEEYITGGEDAADPSYVPPVFPYFEFDKTVSDNKVDDGSLADYLGLPTAVAERYNNTKVSPLPFMAYNKIYNEYYRDQNMVDKVTDQAVAGSNPNYGTINTLQNRAWQHDYYTSALPWTQKGPEATIPLGTTAPIINKTGAANDFNLASWLRNTDGSVTGLGLENVESGTGIPPATAFITTPSSSNNPRQIDISLHSEADLSSATAAGINDLRRAFRLQEWLERNARGGSRYIEVILAHFGVQSSDARLQRPEFLGGSATPITISEVLQTSDPAASGSTPQANMAGHGVSVGSSNYVSYKCEEHGYIMGIMTIMPKTAYQDGIPKHFMKFDKFEYFWPSFANIGEQPIVNNELFVDDTDGLDLETFGYTPRYAEYKYIPSTVHGEFRDSLKFWHMGRIFATRPSLNATFVECNEDEVDRVFAVDDGDENLYVYLHNKVKARRPMPYFGTPTI